MANGDVGCEAYTAIAWGVGLSHERLDIAGAESFYSLEGNMVDGDDMGYVAEGFVNIPVSDTAAIRLVGWAVHDAGWIDNIHGTRTYPGDASTPDDDVTVDNAEFVEDNYNTVDTIGARAALRVNLGENWISIDPSVDYDKTLDQIEDVNDAYAGLFRETQTYLDERIEEVISGGKEPIVVRVFGQNLSVLREKAAEIEEIMGSIEGVEDQHTDISTDVPQLQVEVDLAKAEKYGLKPGDVRRAASTMVAA